MSRLEEIKSILAERKNYKNDSHFVIDTEAFECLILSLEDKKHIDWLVNRVEKLEEENQRYREGLEKIADKSEVDFGNSYTNKVYNHSRKIARQALKGESE